MFVRDLQMLKRGVVWLVLVFGNDLVLREYVQYVSVQQI